VATTPAPVATGPTYDLSPVAEPAGLVGLVRWKNPGSTFSNITTCAGFPSEIIQGGLQEALNAVFRKAFRGQANSKELAGLVALDAPLDAAVALDPQSARGKPAFAFSVGLSSLDRARGALEAASPLVELTPGVWRVGEKDRRDMSCVLAASAGATPARLVCGQREKDVTALAPYLTRTLPTTAPLQSDLHAEMRFVPIDERLGGMLRQQLRGLPVLAQSQATIGDPAFDQAIVDAATAISTEVGAIASDLDRLTIDASVTPSTCANTTLALQMRGKSSWLTGTMIDGADRAGPPPAIFWRLPKESLSAGFGRGADPARYTDILRVLRTLVEGGLTKLQIGSPADRKALADLLQTTLSKGTNVVQASGRIDAPPPKLGPKATEQDKANAMLNSFLGWHLMGFDESAEAMSKRLKDFVSVYNRKGLMDPLKKELGDDARLLPVIKLVPAPAKLGKGALDVEVKVEFPAKEKGFEGEAKPKKGAKKKEEMIRFGFHFLLMPDGKDTWLSFGTNRDELVKRLLSVKSGTPDSETIAARTDLGPLKDGKNVSGGFLTPNLFIKAAVAGMQSSPRPPAELPDILTVLGSLPHKGDSPIFVTTAVNAGDKPRVALSLDVGKPVFEDIGAAILNAFKLRGQSNPPAAATSPAKP